MATHNVKVEVDGLKEARAAVKKAGGSLDDLEAVNRTAATRVQRRAVEEAPHRTGKLQRFIGVDADAKTGKVVGQARVLPYLGPIHFGDVTRNVAKGLSRKTAQQALSGALTRRSINASVRRGKDRTFYYRDKTTGYREVTRRLHGQRGGPIKPNLFMYRAAGDQATLDAVYKDYEKKADEIAKAISWQKGVF